MRARWHVRHAVADAHAKCRSDAGAQQRAHNAGAFARADARAE